MAARVKEIVTRSLADLGARPATVGGAVATTARRRLGGTAAARARRESSAAPAAEAAREVVDFLAERRII